MTRTLDTRTLVVRKPVSRRAQAWRETAFGYGMIALSVAAVAVFTAAPIVASFALAFFRWDAISPPQFVGLANFRAMAVDHTITHSLAVTALIAALIVALQVAVGLGLATLVAQRVSRVTRAAFRTAFFLPTLASAASISIVMSYLFDDHFGVINYYLNHVGLPSVPWLSSTGGATATIVLVAVWQQLGFTFILFVAALTALPTDVLEAATMDGASPVRTFLRVKLPLISPTILFATVVGLINAMQLFDQPYVMTKGGPGESTRTVVLLIYQTAFQNLQFGYASAMSVLLFVILGLVTAVQFWISRRWVFYA